MLISVGNREDCIPEGQTVKQYVSALFFNRKIEENTWLYCFKMVLLSTSLHKSSLSFWT